MRLSINWLKDYVDPKLSVDDLSDRLTMAGLEIEAIETVGNDTVLEIEITPNRPDCLNMLGLAREVGAITAKAVKFPKFKTVRVTGKKIPITISDKNDCRRYIATLIEGVNIASSPANIVERLASMGTRTIANAVDITNFVMFETGQPLHVFDYDKIAGGKIIVRQAKANETIITLDGVERKLDPSILVIADSEKPIAIAGIMGGKNTEVTSSTTRVLLEAAHFDMGLVRRACRSLNLRSDSSYRFERNVDGQATAQAAARAVEFITDLAGGKVTARGETNAIKKSLAKPLKLTDSHITDLLGTTIPLKRAKDILSRLGFAVRGQGKSLLVKAPSYRNDIGMTEDLIEEVARVIGFDKMPTSMPTIKAVNITIDPRPREVKASIHRVLLANGISEAVTYSMTSRKNVSRSLMNADAAVAVTNPLSIEQEILRPALLPTIMPAVVLNINRGNKDLKLFEIGNVFSPSEEITAVAIVMTGRRNSDWRCSRKEEIEFTDIKGIIENISVSLKVSLRCVKAKVTGFDESACAAIEYDGKVIGHAGRLDKNVLVNWGIKSEGIYFAEFNITPLMQRAKTAVRYQPLNEYPMVTRDVSLAVKTDIDFETIAGICRTNGGTLLKEVRFIEQYIGDKIQAGHKGLVFSLTYQSPARTLREDEVNVAHGAILKVITDKTAATIR